MRLFGKMMEVSKKCADIWQKSEPTEKDIRLLELKEELKSPRATLEDKLYILMDLLFEDDKTKEIYVNRFYTLEQLIEQNKTDKYSDKTYRVEPAFGMVDFEEQYHSRIEEVEGTISFDPSTGKYEILKGEQR